MISAAVLMKDVLSLLASAARALSLVVLLTTPRRDVIGHDLR